MRSLIKRALAAAGVEVHRRTHAAPHLVELRRQMHAVGIDHVIDVGANVGQFAQQLRTVLGYRGVIDSFEPDPDAFALLKAVSSGDPKWRVHAVALGETSGHATLTTYADSSLNSVHPMNETGRDLWSTAEPTAVVGHVQVAIRRLDDVLPDITVGKRLFLKMDTQGNDLAVMHGLTKWDDVQLIQTELAFVQIYDGIPLAEDVLSHLRRLGFTLAALTPITRLSDELSVVEADACFVRSGHIGSTT